MKEHSHKDIAASDWKSKFEDLHPADIAELLAEEKETERIIALLHEVPHDKVMRVLVEFDPDEMTALVKTLSSDEKFFQSILEHASHIDDAVDVLNSLPPAQRSGIIAGIQNTEKASDILELIHYPEDSAGGLMSKEFVQVQEKWIALRCVKEMRRQAESVTRIDAVFVVDEDEKLKGILSLKKMLIATSQTRIELLYNREVRYVTANDQADEVVNHMRKYDLMSLPVVDDIGRLVGVVTMDDALDFVVDEAEKDYQLASGISKDVESKDSLWTLTKARFPWLAIGLVGGGVSSRVVGSFGMEMDRSIEIMAFMPLIAAMAGNVGVQSAAIIVQGLSVTGGHIDTKRSELLTKELLLALVNGAACAGLLFGFMLLLENTLAFALSVSVSLVVVIVFAAIFGTVIPLTLHRLNVNPAVATGPFITTLNDIFGLAIYFWISQMILSW